MKKSPLFSIIVLTYQNEKNITKCLNSILNSKYSNKEIIVVDNNSTDGTRDILKKYSKKVKLYFSENNSGYSAGNNSGAKNAKGKYLVFINPDCQVEKNWLEEVEKIILEYPNKIIQPIIVDPRNNKVSVAGKNAHYLGLDWLNGHNSSLSEWKSPVELTSFSGAAIFIPTKLFFKLGMFDEKYFLYHEDSDLAWRARIYGSKIILAPKSIIYHEYHFYSKGENYLSQKRKWFYLERNRLFTLYKNYSYRSLIILFPSIIILEIGIILYSIKQNFFITKLKSYISFIFNLPYLLKTHNINEGKRLISDRLLLPSFSAKLDPDLIKSPFLEKVFNLIFGLYYQGVKKII